MNKKLLIIFLVVFLVALIGFLAWRYSGQEETTAEQYQKGLVVLSPGQGETIISPLKIIGYVNGDGWVPFEAQTGTVELVDSQGRQLVFGILTVVGEWMKLPAFFETTLGFVSSTGGDAVLVFRNENPSGLTEKNKEFRLPVKITPVETMMVKVYFNNGRFDPEFSCNKVFSVERESIKIQAVARAALEELLKGPTQKEKTDGYLTSINSGVKIQSLTIENGVAKVDFDETLEKSVGGSCRVAAIRAQITQTLKQFQTVKQVVISINGRTEDILQP